MKLMQTLVVCAALVAPAAIAQRWEVGGGAGGGFYTSQDVTNPAGSASAKIDTNVAGSVWLDNVGAGHWAGEIRYDYQRGDLALNQGSTKASFGGQSQGMHYDLQWRFASTEAAIQPFVAAGGGIKIYQGTGVQEAYQPLSNFALLTKVQDLTPMVSVGGGLRFKLGTHMVLRVEVHDYLTPFPKKVIAPAANSKIGAGWFEDFVPMVGLSFAN
jgi:hypothetical protein